MYRAYMTARSRKNTSLASISQAWSAAHSVCRMRSPSISTKCGCISLRQNKGGNSVIAHPQRGTVNLLKNVRNFQNAIAAHFLLSSVQHCRLLQHLAANDTPSRPLKYRQYRLTAGLDA